MNISLKAYWSLFARYLTTQRRRVVLLTVVLLGGIGFQIANPQVLRVFIDAALTGAPLRDLMIAAALFLGLALLVQFLTVLATYLSEVVGWTATNALRVDLVDHCLNLDLAFHTAHTPGELLERVDGDVSALARFFSQLVVQVFGNALLLVGILIALGWEDWRLGLSAGLFVFISLIALIRLRSRWVIEIARTRQAMAEFFGVLGENLTGLEDVQANGASGYAQHRMRTLLPPWLRFYHRSRRADTSLWGASVLLFAVGNSIALGLGAYLFGTGSVTIGTVFMIFFYMNLIRGPMERVRNELEELQRAEAAIYRIRNLFAVEPQLPPGGNTTLPEGALRVQIEDLSFAYPIPAGRGNGLDLQDYEEASPNERFVLHNVSLALESGQVLGLLGRTGSGKSTLARLLLGLYSPQTGMIRLGGVALSDTPRLDLPRHVGLVTQEVQLFQASVRDNLTFFDPSIADVDLHEAMALLGLQPWFTRLPQGLDTQLGADGVGLSAGEAQLLAVARLFLKNPGLVILDEASARLDPATEQLIEDAMSRLFANRTAIIIAHRLQTVQRADQILILEQGRVAEYGNRVDLVANPDSLLSKLLRTGISEVLS
ncbi:MAG: ABC transporter ATP-binding protein [Chloroflexota bacterium]